MYLFGSGTAIVTPSGATQTPLNFGLLQEMTIDVTQSNKPLYGQYKDPLAIGGGTRKWTGKAKVARFSMQVLNALMFGTTISAGQIAEQFGESHSVPTTPFTVTVTNSATWTQDLGVVYASTGLPLTRVASGPTVGQYSVSAGVYTFASADSGAGVLISYLYTITSTGQNFSVPSTLIGSTITFALNATILDPTQTNVTTLQFPNCVASKFSFGTKLEDFAMPEFDFDLFANAAGQIFIPSTPDKF
jgi:hypothetical protein